MAIMKRLTGFVFCAAALLAADAKLKLADLPAVVRQAVQDNLKGGELKGLSKEKEKGKTYYEVETMLNGKSRDMVLDAAGVVTEVEEEIELSAVPKAAMDAITMKAAGAKVTKVESLTKAGKIVAYEAGTLKGTKKSEVAVTPDGKPFKD